MNFMMKMVPSVVVLAIGLCHTLPAQGFDRLRQKDFFATLPEVGDEQLRIEAGGDLPQTQLILRWLSADGEVEHNSLQLPISVLGGVTQLSYSSGAGTTSYQILVAGSLNMGVLTVASIVEVSYSGGGSRALNVLETMHWYGVDVGRWCMNATGVRVRHPIRGFTTTPKRHAHESLPSPSQVQDEVSREQLA